MSKLFELEGCWGEYYEEGEHVCVHLDDPQLLAICEKCEYTEIGPKKIVGTFVGHTKANGRVRDTVRYDTPNKCPGCGQVHTHFFGLCEKYSKYGGDAEEQVEEEAPHYLTRVRNGLRELVRVRP